MSLADVASARFQLLQSEVPRPDYRNAGTGAIPGETRRVVFKHAAESTPWVAASSDPVPGGMALDSTGALYVAGGFGYLGPTNMDLNSADGDTTLVLTPSSGAAKTGFLAKYSSSGALLWAARASGTAGSEAFFWSVATDPLDNVYASGHCYSTDLRIYDSANQASAPLSRAGGTMLAFLAKFTSEGALLWAVRVLPGNVPGAGSLSTSNVATDSAGQVYMSTYMDVSDTAVYSQDGSSVTVPGSSTIDILLLKYSADADLLWHAVITGSANERPGWHGLDVVRDRGDVIIGLTSDSPNMVARSAQGVSVPVPAARAAQFALVAYGAEGTVLWVSRLDDTRMTTSVETSQCVAASLGALAFAAGCTNDVTIYPGLPLPPTQVPAASSSYAVIARVSLKGGVDWAATVSNAACDSLSFDALGNLVCLCRRLNASGSTQVCDGVGESALVALGTGQLPFLASFAADGRLLWAQAFDTGAQVLAARLPVIACRGRDVYVMTRNTNASGAINAPDGTPFQLAIPDGQTSRGVIARLPLVPAYAIARPVDADAPRLMTLLNAGDAPVRVGPATVGARAATRLLWIDGGWMEV